MKKSKSSKSGKAVKTQNKATVKSKNSGRVSKPAKSKAPAKTEVKSKVSKKPVQKAGLKKAEPVKQPEVKAKKIKLSAKLQSEFKDMLISMRQRLTGQIAALQGDSLQRQDSVNSEEDGTDAFERQFALNIASTENDVVFEIDEALQRIDQNSYGACEQCGGGIEEARLKALPFVRMCIKCKTENEKGARRFRPTPV